jgi:hypothetical protein
MAVPHGLMVLAGVFVLRPRNSSQCIQLYLWPLARDAMASFRSPSLSRFVPAFAAYCLFEELIPSFFALNYGAPTLDFMSDSSLSL